MYTNMKEKNRGLRFSVKSVVVIKSVRLDGRNNHVYCFSLHVVCLSSFFLLTLFTIYTGTIYLGKNRNEQRPGPG